MSGIYSDHGIVHVRFLSFRALFTYISWFFQHILTKWAVFCRVTYQAPGGEANQNQRGDEEPTLRRQPQSEAALRKLRSSGVCQWTEKRYMLY